MNIACVIDRKKSVQHIRYNILVDMFKEHSFTLYTHNKKIPHKYDVIYYMSHGLYNKWASKGRRVVMSITSHEWLLQSRKQVFKTIKLCHAVSVNNKILYAKLKKGFKKVVYIPNGVDVDFFTPGKRKFDSGKIKLGWVGKKDRKTKNYATIIKPLCRAYSVATVVSKKGKGHSKSRKQMLKFYRSIDFLLVASNTEGTPNPALEAASCGVPVVSTKVGNMIDIIRHGDNGFIVPRPSIKLFQKILNRRVKNIDEHKYKSMSSSIRNDIKSGWDWSQRKKKFRIFFTGEE